MADSRVERQRRHEFLLGVRRHAAFGGEHAGFAQRIMAMRRRPQQAQRLLEGGGGVGGAAVAQIEGGDHLIAAAILRMLGEMRLYARHRARYVAMAWLGLEPRLERGVGQVGMAELSIEQQGQGRDQQDRSGRRDQRVAAGGGGCASGHAASAQQAAGRFRPRGLDVGGGEAPLGALAVDLGDLLLEKGDVGGRGVGRAAFARERPQHAHHCGAGQESEEEPDHGPAV